VHPYFFCILLLKQMETLLFSTIERNNGKSLMVFASAEAVSIHFFNLCIKMLC